jgi:uncharacterized membrane protein HdeD (DUF308 family)
METKSFKNWWFLMVNGIIAMLFGLMLVLYTKESITVFVMYFGVVILIAGLMLVVSALINLKKDKRITLLIIQSITSIGLGAFLILAPENSLKIFQILIGVWAILLGIIQLVILVNVKRNLTNKNVFLINGLMTIALGVIMFFDPFTFFAVFLIKILGLLSVLFGLILIYLSFIIRKVTRAVESGAGQ